MQEDMDNKLLFVDDNLKREANMPKAYWHGLPKTEQIPNNGLIRKYFEDHVKAFSNSTIPNMFINVGSLGASEQALTKVVIGFLARSFRVYCVSAPFLLETIENKSLYIGDCENGWESITNVKVLAIYGLGAEPDNDFGKANTALLKVIERRFFLGLPTLFCSSMTHEEIIKSNLYSPHLLNRIFSNCVIIRSN